MIKSIIKPLLVQYAKRKKIKNVLLINVNSLSIHYSCDTFDVKKSKQI